jgi:RNA polymerase sigma-70 factor (ECF subfamily)
MNPPVESRIAEEDETRLVARLRDGDEAAFAELVDRYHTGMVRLATVYVRDEAAAEDVAQEAWIGVLRGIDRFEARSSLKTWIFHILINRAKTRATREQRSIPFSALWDADTAPFEPAVEPERFRPPGAQWAGGWVSFPQSWGAAPEERLLSGEAREQIQACIDTLPPSQREVVVLRDVQGWSAEEVCAALQVSEANQRVLLHRGRSKVRRALERYLTGE